MQVQASMEAACKLVRMGCEKSRTARSDIKLGICCEHGGEPSSVIFCHKIGLDYVSCLWGAGCPPDSSSCGVDGGMAGLTG